MNMCACLWCTMCEHHSFVKLTMFFDGYNQMLKITPAKAAGVTKQLWEIGDVVSVLEACKAI